MVYLSLAVILFRGFLAEGYMISTGSMAPFLLGYHRQVVCPSCSFTFSRGAHFDEDDTILADSQSPSIGDFGVAARPSATVCPNCGLSAIDTSAVPLNEGDQLLVHKHFYQLRAPRRWETVVFRHPNDPDQAYVKRVVGLPDEAIELVDGDVYADGRLQRKPLEIQRSMRIAVYDQDYEPSDPEWHPRWQLAENPRWSTYQEGFIHRRGTDSGAASDIDWMTYHHWTRGGGRHLTRVDLPSWPAGISRALDRLLTYDESAGQLQYEGVLSPHIARRLRHVSTNAEWLAAINLLEQESHESPVVDAYGYNHPDSGDGPCAVHDLMLEAVIRRVQGDGECRLQMTDGWHDFEAVLDFEALEVRLHIDGNSQPQESAPFPNDAFADTQTTLEMSLIDRQVVIALNGELVFEPLAYAVEEQPRELTSRPVRVGARGIDLQLSHLRLYRDVYYTPKHAPGRTASAQLGPDEFFMLGDNSPVSLDSRAWDSPAIPRELFIGKPFLVHLPSRQERVEVAGDVHHIRIPDLSRVRYIR